MKKRKILSAFLLVLLSGGYVFAEWIVDFRDIYLEQGIDAAVIEALKQGANADGIMENGLKLEGLNPQNLVKAMYCGGVRGDDIKAAGDQFGVSELVIVAGYKKSVEECGDVVVDTQAYTPVGTPTRVSFRGTPSPTTPTSSSPYRF